MPRNLPISFSFKQTKRMPAEHENLYGVKTLPDLDFGNLTLLRRSQHSERLEWPRVCISEYEIKNMKSPLLTVGPQTLA